jgi:hypothetical protein
MVFNAALCAQAADADYVENSQFTGTVAITFSGTSATVVNGAGAGVTCAQTNASLIITSTVAGVEYVLSGTSAGGYVKIQSTYAPKLTLNGVNLTCTNGPAISIQSTSRCFVVLAEGASNALTDSSTYTQTGEGTLHSTGPLIFSGRGSVAVTGKKKHGICSATYIRMLGGDVTVPAAVKDGLHCVQFFRMDDGSLTVAATSDGVDADVGYVQINGGSISILSTADDTKGIKCDGTLTVNGGAVNMTVNGVQSKGLKSAANMAINGGTLMFNLSGAMYLATVTNTSNSYVEPSYCTAIKCDTNITFNDGIITITHTGMAGKGISADGNITILGGTFDIVTAGGCSTVYTNSLGVLDVAAADCLKADHNLSILGGTINALSRGNAGDAISCDGEAVIGVAGVTNTPVITAATRGQKVLVSGSGMTADYSNPKAFKAEGNLTVNGGIFRATTKNDGGEGLESKAGLTIHGGLIDITAYDDCINAATNITINGGMIYCYSMGNDGIDSNGKLQINGGTIVSSGTTAPEEGFDCDVNTFSINGGIMVGTGGGSSTPTSASCTQRSVLYTTNATAGTIIQIKSASGNNLVYKIPRTYSGGGGGPGGGSGGMLLLLSNPGVAAGTTYTIVSGATVTGGTEFHGLYTGATVSGGTTVKTFTASSSSMVTTVQ